ncbi:MFS transporter [Idiomarina sp. HP20-50]|uniref:MFS transporter n=1 Tax=Idiomarina sp. HP20-50 TaxID=3070813 RepID=UPI00294AF948|nr:MFS transporter [Idiomarina sp. HP20-50]MDV6314850.1 MFS transporter [Idiomarina sp. HP20-50]
MIQFSKAQVQLAIFAMAIGSFAIGIGEFVIMGLLPDVATDFNTDTRQTGHLISLYALGVVIGAPLITILFARFPRKPMLLALLLAFALGNFASASADSYPLLQVLRFLTGLPHGAYFGIACLVAADMVHKNQRGMAVTMVMMGLTIAILVGNPLATWLGQLIDWRTVYYTVGALGLLALIMIFFVVPQHPNERKTSARNEIQALQNPQVWLTLAIGAIGFGGMFSVLSYIAPTLINATGLAPHWIPVALFIYGIGSLGGSLVGGWAADRNLKLTIGGSLLWSAIVLAIFPLTLQSLWSIMPMVLLLGSAAALVPALQVRLMDVAGEAQTLAASLNHSAFNAANALGAWLGGLAIISPLSWQGTGWVGCALALAGLLLFWITKKHSRKTPNIMSL